MSHHDHDHDHHHGSEHKHQCKCKGGDHGHAHKSLHHYKDADSTDPLDKEKVAELLSYLLKKNADRTGDFMKWHDRIKTAGIIAITDEFESIISLSAQIDTTIHEALKKVS